MQRLISSDPIRRITKIFHADASGENYTLETRQDLQPLLDLAAAERSLDTGNFKGDGVHKVGYLTNEAIAELNAKGVLQGTKVLDQKKLLAFLNDRDYSKLRTKAGHL
jgi:hypothetical protein